jgi:hypothetical protein
MPTETLIKPIEVVTDGIFRPSNLSTNFDQNLIAPYIALAEEANTVRILGVDLYEDMILNQNPLPSNYNPNAGAIVLKFPTVPEYELLWTKFLLRYEGLIVVNYALPFIGLQTSTQGVLLKNTEFAENAGIEGIKFLQDTIQKPIDDLEPRIKDYLCKNKGDFEKFDSSVCPCNEEASSCKCGYYEEYKKPCKLCKIGRDSSTKIIFY